MATSWERRGNLTGPSGGPGYLAGPVPPGTTTPTIAHGLDTYDLVVWVRDAETWAWTPAANRCVDADTIELVFTTAPTAGEYRFLILAAAPSTGVTVVPPQAAEPLAHAATHAADGTDPVAPDAIGAAPADHAHADYAAANHGHTPASIGAAPDGHSHPEYAASGETGSLYSLLSTGWLSTSESSPSTHDHTFTTPVAGKISTWQKTLYFPQEGAGWGGRPQLTRVRVGIELVRDSDGAVLVSDRRWVEGATMDNGYGLYMSTMLDTFLTSDRVLPAGTYRARAVIATSSGGNIPRVSLQWLKTLWQVIRA